MKPLPHRLYLLTLILSSLFCFVILLWWLLFVLRSFQEIATPVPPTQSLELNQSDYNTVHKALQEQ